MSEPQDKPPVETGAEPLARPRRTLWQRLGGEGLALSVLVHIVLVLIANLHIRKIAIHSDQRVKRPRNVHPAIA